MRRQNRFPYATITSTIPFPPSLLNAAAQAASTDAAWALHDAERKLAMPGVKPIAIHRQVLQTQAVARSLTARVR